MHSGKDYILTVNAGSSSIKLAVFRADPVPAKTLEAVVENIGQRSATLVVRNQIVPNLSLIHI